MGKRHVVPVEQFGLLMPAAPTPRPPRVLRAVPTPQQTSAARPVDAAWTLSSAEHLERQVERDRGLHVRELICDKLWCSWRGRPDELHVCERGGTVALWTWIRLMHRITREERGARARLVVVRQVERADASRRTCRYGCPTSCWLVDELTERLAELHSNATEERRAAESLLAAHRLGLECAYFETRDGRKAWVSE